MQDDSWITQYKKMIRARDKLVKLFPIKSNINLEYLFDSFDEFVITCTHLADWLAKCGFKTAFSYRDNNKYLAICNKLANTRKHFKITKGQDSDIPLRTYLKPNDEVTIFFSSTGNSSQYHNGNMPVNIAPTSILSTGDFIIETDKMIIKVLDLINECINYWHEYLEQNNIDYKSL